MSVSSVTVSGVVRETMLPNGQVTGITERVIAGAPGESGSYFCSSTGHCQGRLLPLPPRESILPLNLQRVQIVEWRQA